MTDQYCSSIAQLKSSRLNPVFSLFYLPTHVLLVYYRPIYRYQLVYQRSTSSTAHVINSISCSKLSHPQSVGADYLIRLASCAPVLYFSFNRGIFLKTPMSGRGDHPQIDSMYPSGSLKPPGRFVQASFYGVVDATESSIISWPAFRKDERI